MMIKEKNTLVELASDLKQTEEIENPMENRQVSSKKRPSLPNPWRSRDGCSASSRMLHLQKSPKPGFRNFCGSVDDQRAEKSW
jgi:hypothetical protein